jgi:hypothetical protein
VGDKEWVLSVNEEVAMRIAALVLGIIGAVTGTIGVVFALLSRWTSRPVR